MVETWLSANETGGLKHPIMKQASGSVCTVADLEWWPLSGMFGAAQTQKSTEFTTYGERLFCHLHLNGTCSQRPAYEEPPHCPRKHLFRSRWLNPALCTLT